MRTRTSLAGICALLGLAGAGPACGGERDATPLPAPRREGELSVERALAQRRSLREYAEAPLALAEVAQLLWACQGTTSSRGLRTAPSAGALYPLEVYLVAGEVSGLAAGAYRYDPRHHRLLAHKTGDLREAIARAALEQSWLADAPAVLVLTGVPRRTARKYGGRAPRYVYIEAGHAAQNVYLQAGALGLGTVIVGAFDDDRLANVLELPAQEAPLALLPVGRPR